MPSLDADDLRYVLLLVFILVLAIGGLLLIPGKDD